MIQKYNTYKILQVFFDFPAKHFQLREICRMVNITLPSVRNHVKKLEKDGFVKVIVDKKTKCILGAEAIGSSASVLIAEMCLAITNRLTIDDVVDTIHAHPTLSESWVEALLISQNRPINFPPNISS